MSRKIDSLLDGLERNQNLTKDGRAWLIAACDPFHDQDINIAGYPDISTASTVVQLVKKQIQITVPPTTGPGAVATGSNWDCSIVLFPTLTSPVYETSASVDQTGLLIGATTISNPIHTGALTVVAGPQGTDLWPGPTEVGSGAVNVLSSELDCTEYCKGNERLIAAGFEVVNTTAEINLQGQVTAWRQPTQATLTQIQQAIPGEAVLTCINTAFNAQRYPPANVASAQQLFGSRSWAAKEGGYVVLRQNSDLNPLRQPGFTPIMWTLNDVASGQTSYGNIAGPTISSGWNNPSDIMAPFDISGLHFTGLSYATSLTVNVRWFIERMPSSSESDLVVLATPSSCYDPLALELYARCMNDMPPGVMLKENPLGEWFRNALAKVATIAPKIGNFVGNFVPGAAAVGEGVGAVAKYAKKLIPKEQKKDKIESDNPKKLQGSASTARMLVK